MKNRNWRRALLTLTAFILAAFAAAPAQSQSQYPDQAIRFIIPAGAGGLPDTVARIVARRLQEKVGQSVVVENKPGGNGSVSVAALMSAPPDGYSFIVQDGSIYAINPHIYARMAYSVSDLIPTVMIARAPLFLAVHRKVPVKTMQEFIAYVKANPGKLNYGSSGVGSTHHLSMEAFNAALGLQMNHIPYKGSSETIGAILGGHIDILFAAYAGLRPAAESKKVAILASNGPKRSPQAPDVPAIAELSPGFDLAVIQGITTRVGAPRAAVEKIAAEMAEIVKEPEIISQFNTAGIEPIGAGPEEYRAALNAEAERMAKIAEKAGLKAQ